MTKEELDLERAAETIGECCSNLERSGIARVTIAWQLIYAGARVMSACALSRERIVHVVDLAIADVTPLDRRRCGS